MLNNFRKGIIFKGVWCRNQCVNDACKLYEVLNFMLKVFCLLILRNKGAKNPRNIL